MHSFTQKLSSEDASVRNSAALQIIDGKLCDLVPMLIEVIHNPQTKGANGTLVYALGHFDCSGYFVDLVKFAVTLGYEAHFEAMCILVDQDFNISEDDVATVNQVFKQAQGIELEDFNREAIDMIRERFLK